MRTEKLIKHLPTILAIGFLLTVIDSVEPAGTSGFLGKLDTFYQSIINGNTDVIERAFFLASFQYGALIFLGLYAFVKIGNLILTD